MDIMRRARFYAISAAVSFFLIASAHLLARLFGTTPSELLKFALIGALAKDICDYASIAVRGMSIWQPEFEHLPFSVMATAYGLLSGDVLLVKLGLLDSIIDGTQDVGRERRRITIIGAIAGACLAVLMFLL